MGDFELHKFKKVVKKSKEMFSALKNSGFKYAICHHRNSRFISVSSYLSGSSKKILSEFKVTPREYHEQKDEERSDNPIKFSATRAIQGPTREESMGIGFVQPKTRPKWEGTSISISCIVFALYFFILREENYVDELISQLGDPTLGGREMLKTIEEYKREGKDTTELEKRYVDWEESQAKLLGRKEYEEYKAHKLTQNS